MGARYVGEIRFLYHRMKYSKYGSESIFGGMAVEHLTLKPSEYWLRQCHVGASFLRPTEAPLCAEIGIDNICGIGLPAY